ncbi:MAG: hypothetical protein KDG52_17260 [Rhodocyclaceae bacterium]|nr:hypothetical protein [Rhodocyclaceae bacterium]
MTRYRTKAARTALRLLGTAATLTMLAGCFGKEGYGPDGYRTKMDMSGDVIGAIVIDKNGEIAVVGADKQELPRCSLPGEDGKYRTCGKLENTRVSGISSYSMVRHTGSTCYTIGPFGHGGNIYYYQIPFGCTP